jgi:hypothetical protein
MQPQDPISTDINDPQQPERNFITKAEAQQSLEDLRNLAYKQQLQELAQHTTYVILLQDTSTGQKIPDPEDRRKTIIFYGDNEWEVKVFKRFKITVDDYKKADELYLYYAEIDPDEEEQDDDAGERKIDAIMQFYQFLAVCYLRMSVEDFQRADWGRLKMVLDACQYRTVRTLPKLSKALYEYYHFGKANLNEDEYECLKTYRLWTGKSKTKPWEYNGGFVYEEDLNMVLQMEELDISGQNFRAKKQQHKAAGGGEVGEDGVVHRKTTRVKNQ